MCIVTIIVSTLGDAMYYVMFVLFVMMLVIVHRSFFGFVLVGVHLFVVPLLFVTLLRRRFLSKHQRGIVGDGTVEGTGHVASHHGS